MSLTKLHADGGHLVYVNLNEALIIGTAIAPDGNPGGTMIGFGGSSVIVTEDLDVVLRKSGMKPDESSAAYHNW